MSHSTASESWSRDQSVSRSTSKSATESNEDSELEKFPDHIDAPMFASNDKASDSPVGGLNIFTNGIKNVNGVNGLPSPGVNRWQPRKDNYMPGLSWGGQPAAISHGHSKQKSISEAIHTIRGRRGSVSQNAQEIAGALRAPISPKLIVCCGTPVGIRMCLADNLFFIDTVCDVVYIICPDQHLVEVDSQCLPEARYTDVGPILLGGLLLHHIVMAGLDLSQTPNVDTGFEVPNTISVPRCCRHNFTLGPISNRRPSPQLYSYLEDTRIVGTYRQGAFTTLHRPRLPIGL